MSLTVSVCCGAGVHVESSGPNDRASNWYACDECMKPCATETIAERDHRMRVEGAVAACLVHMKASGQFPRSLEAEVAAERIVREMKERDKR